MAKKPRCNWSIILFARFIFYIIYSTVLCLECNRLPFFTTKCTFSSIHCNSYIQLKQYQRPKASSPIGIIWVVHGLGSGNTKKFPYKTHLTIFHTLNLNDIYSKRLGVMEWKPINIRCLKILQSLANISSVKICIKPHVQNLRFYKLWIYLSVVELLKTIFHCQTFWNFDWFCPPRPMYRVGHTWFFQFFFSSLN